MAMTTALDWYTSIETPRIEEIKLDFAVALEGAAISEGISKVELARRAGVTPARITKALRGDSNLTLETMEKLAEAANRTVHIYLALRNCEVFHFDVVKDQSGKVGQVETTNDQGQIGFSEPEMLEFTNVQIKNYSR